MIWVIASSIGFFSRISLTSIRLPAKAKLRMFDSASFSVYRNNNRNCAIAATEPDTSHSTMTLGLSIFFCFQTVMNGIDSQAMLRRMVLRVSSWPRFFFLRLRPYFSASFLAMARTITRIRSMSRRSMFDSRDDFKSSSRNFSFSPLANNSRLRSTKSRTRSRSRSRPVSSASARWLAASVLSRRSASISRSTGRMPMRSMMRRV